MPFSVRLETEACRVDRAMLPDTGDDILQGAAGRRVVDDIIDGDHGDAAARTKVRETGKVFAVAALKGIARSEVERARPKPGQVLQHCLESRSRTLWRKGYEHLAFTGGGDVREGDQAVTLLRPPLAI